MKNHRDVCFATRAGFSKYDGVAGSIKTGCPNTPAFKSRYCKVHAPVSVKSNSVIFSSDEVKPCKSNIEGPLATILQKRETRQNVYYQVQKLALV